MSTVQDIYNELFTGATVTVHCEDPKSFETLRTALCKKNQLQVALDLTTGSIIGRYDEQQQAATFTLGPSQRKLSENRWTILRSE